MRTAAILLIGLGIAWPAGAQEAWTYRVRFQAESTSNRGNEGSPGRQPQRWTSSQLFVLSGDAGWTPHERIRVAGSASAVADGAGDVDGRLREGYVRGSALSWLDVEAGKRIVRWGVGYGFAPAGVLDPARSATDPTDRLQLNEGRAMIKADLYQGESTLTFAAAEDIAAARFGTMLDGGVEVGLIAAAGPEDRPRYAATVTHVVGQQLELHAEVASHEDGRGRTTSAVAGLQYTFATGLNVVVEYHRNGRSRQNALFFRAARAGNDLALSPEAIAILNTDDGSWTMVPSITWTPRRRLQIYMRGTRLWGGPGSPAKLAPASSSLTAGGVVRF